jgi:hypothetical protein
MTQNETVIEGTPKPDGTLELDEKPNLPPGRVKVVLRREAESRPLLENWWRYMQRSRRELEASGARFMDEPELEAHIDWLREGDRIDDELLRPEPS